MVQKYKNKILSKKPLIFSIRHISIVFYVLKWKGLFDSLTKPIAVLDVASIVANPWVKDVMKGVFSQKQVTQKSDGFCIPVIHPHMSEISYGINDPFFLLQLWDKVVVIHSASLSHLSDLVFVLLYEGNNCLSIVFWNVLCLIFEPLLDQ